MTKKVFQLFLAGCISLVLIACQNREADDEAEFEFDNVPIPTQRQDAQDVAVDETFFSTSSSEVSENLTLYSFSAPETDNDAIDSAQVFSADEGMVLKLDISGDNGAKADVTILVNNDTIYAVNHETDKLQLVRHFANKICEIHAKEVVESEITGEGDDAVETLTVRHADSIYVMTALKESGVPCSDVDASKFYYELPLNYQFDSTFVDQNATDELTIVDEAVAKAKLIFGWVESSEADSEHVLSYGYLGYSHAERKLQFFDKDRVSVWSQPRELATYPQITANGFTSPFYLFDVQALHDYQYLIQLNQDIFVVDASQDLFNKKQSDVSDILADRVLKIGTYSPYVTGSDAAGINKAEALYDDDDLVVIDNGKVYAYDYSVNKFTPASTPHEYELLVKEGYSYREQAFQEKRTFSQFDYQQCPIDEADCIAAHEIGDADWQFIGECDSELGCIVEDTVADFCETQAEHDVSQSGRDICSPEFYQHIEELNNEENDAELAGYMRYFENFINHYHASFLDDSIVISASMIEKDIVVQYFFKQPLNAPKSIREYVLFGQEAELFGLDHYVENQNLFVNALIPDAIRSNECYKGYVSVGCDLGSQEDGGTELCTGRDLEAGLCYASFTEFESTALFCSGEEVLRRECVDENLFSDEFRVESAEEDAKWVRLLDLSGEESDKQSMFLLSANHADAINEEDLGEGNLLRPTLHEVNDSSGIPGLGLGTLVDKVETVVGGVYYQRGTSQEPLFEGALDILTTDAGQPSSGAALVSHLSKYAIVSTLSSENNAVSVHQMEKLADSVFNRLETTPRTVGEVEEE